MRLLTSFFFIIAKGLTSITAEGSAYTLASLPGLKLARKHLFELSVYTLPINIMRKVV